MTTLSYNGMRPARRRALGRAALALPDVVIRLWDSIGDTLYMRPFVVAASQQWDTVYLETSWPQLFYDLPNVVPCAITPAIRIAQANLAKYENLPEAPREPDLRPEYSWGHLTQGLNVTSSTERSVPMVDVSGSSFRLPLHQDWLNEAERRLSGLGLPRRQLCVYRPPTLRKKWLCASRNPDQTALDEFIDGARGDVAWLAIGSLSPNERLASPLPRVHASIMDGSLSLGGLIALLSLADVVVTPPCFALPASAAAGGRTLAVFGGSLPPAALISPLVRTGFSDLEVVAPDPFCACGMMEHQCQKSISVSELTKAWRRLLSRAPSNSLDRRVRDSCV